MRNSSKVQNLMEKKAEAGEYNSHRKVKSVVRKKEKT
jgi:hypothetical protein